MAGRTKRKKITYVGRPTLYDQKVVDKSLDYLENYEDTYDHPFPSQVGLSKVLGRSIATLNKWRVDETKPEFNDIMNAIVAQQELVLLNKGITGTFNPAITSLVLGKHGYHKKVDSVLTGADGGPIATKTLTVTGVESQHPDSD